jgi:two-component system OmpR family response regulator
VSELSRIMYVDDEPDIRTIVDLVLHTLEGFSVTLCASGAEALQRAPEILPQLVLLDVMMPGMDGPETFRALRALPATSAVPVVFVTAKVQPVEVARFRGLGAADVIAKPFDPLALAGQVRAIWSRVAAA